MKTSFGKLTASILAVALLLGAFGLFTQATQAGVDKATPKRVAAPAVLLDVNAALTSPAATGGGTGILRDTVNLDSGSPGVGSLLTTTEATGTAEASTAAAALVHAGQVARDGLYLKITADASTAGSALEGVFCKIEDYNDTTANAFTFQNSCTLAAAGGLTAAVGDTYAIVDATHLFEKNWLEMLTGPAAGSSALINKQDLAVGSVTWKSDTGMELSANPGTGNIYRILESRPNSVTALKVAGDVVAGVAYSIAVDNDSVGFPPESLAAVTKADDGIYPFSKAAATGTADTVKFMVAPSSTPRTLVLVDATSGAGNVGGTTVLDTGRTEPAGYWVGHTLTVGVAERLITCWDGVDGSGAACNSGIADVFVVAPAFSAQIANAAAYKLSIEQLPGFHEQKVSFTHGVFPRDVTVDNIGPIISAVTPKKGAVLGDGTIVFSADIIDLFAGFTSKDDSIDDQASGAAPKDGRINLEIAGSVVPGEDVTWTKIPDGWNLSYALSLSDGIISWRIIARDRAGSQTVQDHSTSSKNRLTVDGTDPEMEEANAARHVDLAIRTGDNWKASETTGRRWRMGPTPAGSNNRGGKSSRTGVLVVFVEAGGLDVDTVDPSDFKVNGVVPISATTIDVIEDSKEAPDSKKRRPQEVFLKMADSLPSDGKDASGDKIKIQLQGVVRDVAGNSATLETKDIADGIPPKITITTDTNYSQDDVTVTVTVDETLSTTPSIEVDYQSSKAGALSGVPVSPVMTATGANSYEVDLEFDDAGSVPDLNQARKLNLVVTATDVNGNEGDEGESNAEDADAITVQIDPELNNSLDPEFTVAGKKIWDGYLQDGGGGITGANLAEIEAVTPLLITIDFSRQCGDTAGPSSAGGCAAGGEKKEYQGDKHKTVTITADKVEVELDDGSKVKPEYTLSSADSIKFTIAISNPPIGDYTITVSAIDQAGNVSKTVGATIPDEITSGFTVDDADPVKLDMNPGWNLISLPFQPPNPSINSVIPADHPASLVMSYNNTTRLWSVSRRDADSGLFTGDVRQMTASAAYFVFTDSLEPIEVLRPSLATAAAAPAVPPAVPVSQGWNLVPVLSNVAPLPDGVSADAYFGTLRTSGGEAGWLKALRWDTATQTWVSVSPGDVVARLKGQVVNILGGANAVVGTPDTNNDDVGDDDVYFEVVAASPDFNDACGATHSAPTKVEAPGAQPGDGAVETVSAQLCIGEGIWVWSTVDAVIIP